MIEAPSRVTDLIRRLELGEAVTQQDVDRIAQLQMLDLAKIGEDFVRQVCLENERQTDEFRQAMGGA